MATKQLSDNNTDGTVLGQSTTDKISFFGVSTVTQQTLTSAVSSATGLSALGDAVAEIQDVLAALGLTNTAP